VFVRTHEANVNFDQLADTLLLQAKPDHVLDRVFTDYFWKQYYPVRYKNVWSELFKLERKHK
jgi:hypothetical protein